MSDRKKAKILVTSIYQDLGDSFLEVLSPEQIDGMSLGDSLVSFDVAAGVVNQEQDFKEQVAKADAVAVIVRFLDVLSLEKIKAIYRTLPVDKSVPVGVIMLRDPDEVDFKISCPACGQKLWLRDTDVGKRGRCPNCKKPFVIMSQQDHIKNQLMLADGVPIMRVIRGDLNSFERAVDTLVKSVFGGIRPMISQAHIDALKNVTTRIEIP